MLQRQPSNILFTGFHDFAPAGRSLFSAENTEPEEADAELEEAARTERDYLRQRLRDELGREPTEQELDDWLRQHTEGY